MHPPTVVPWLLALLVMAAPAAKGQAGYREAAVPEVGLTYQCARNYDAIPTEPSEEWIVAQWAEQMPKDEKKRKALRPQLRVVWIERQIAKPLTQGDGPPPPPEDGEEAGQPAASTPPPPPRINSMESYLEAQLDGWKPQERTAEKERDGFRGEMTALVHAKSDAFGWMYSFSDPDRVCLFVGFCAKEDSDEQVRIWRTMARSARFGTPKPVDVSKWARFYEKSPKFVGAEYRLKVRSQLVRGWQADDTENYIFVYSTRDVKLLEIMKRELESIREEYMRLFPPVKPITAVSTVRICKSVDEYHQYGGPRGTGGYWNPREEELVFFDYDSLDEPGRKKKGTANSRIVLYHEAFHQFVHYSAGELPPHSWFNEGTGDYFSGARISNGKVRGIGVNTWRIERIQRGIAEGSTVPWDKLLNFEQPEFYDEQIVGMCYAQAWSLIYFLRESRVAQKHPQWSRINTTYFDTLKEAFADELTKPPPPPAKNGKAVHPRTAAGIAARKRALELAFKDVDLKALDKEWRSFILGLQVPK